MPTSGYFLEKLSDTTKLVETYDTTSGAYTTTTVEDNALFYTNPTTADGVKDFINANNTSTNFVGVRPGTRP